MDLETAIRERRSIRQYEQREIPQDMLKEVIGTALWAPSGMNLQAWRIMVVRGPQRDRLLEIISRSQEHMIEHLRGVFSEKIIKISLQVFKNLGGAPAIILISIRREPVTHASDDDDRARYHGEFKRYNQLLSASALIQNLLLAAHARGLGTCWMTGPKYMEKEINELLDITDEELVSVIPIGFPAQSPPAPPRKEDVVRWIGF
jgi:nitroreductase